MKHEFEINDGGRSIYFTSKKAGDCVIRAIAIATEADYMQVMRALFQLSFETGHLPNDVKTYGVYLEANGWRKQKTLKNAKGKKYLLGELPVNETAIVHTTKHLVCIKNNAVQDNWDCRAWCANSYFIKVK